MPTATKHTKATQEKPTSENPKWTRKRISKAMRFQDLSPDLQTVLAPKARGAQKSPTKKPVSVRLSPDVLAALKATGQGWQTRMDDALRTHFVIASPARSAKKSIARTLIAAR